MMDAQKDLVLLFEIKDGHQKTKIEGASDDLMAAAAFMACRICALMGRTPEAAELARQEIVSMLNDVGPDTVRGMFWNAQKQESEVN